MSKVKVTCPRCEHEFKTEEADIYECPKCGTSIRSQESDDDFDSTQIFHH